MIALSSLMHGVSKEFRMAEANKHIVGTGYCGAGKSVRLASRYVVCVLGTASRKESTLDVPNVVG